MSHLQLVSIRPHLSSSLDMKCKVCLQTHTDTFLRKTLSPITLSDNTHLPKNTIIEINWYGVSKDADIYPDPDTFDPLRFYKIRTDPETAAKQGTEAANQLVHVSPTHLTWSYGRSACPGRFVAAHIIKLIFATLLLRYEVRNAEGVEGRVKNIRAVGMVRS